MPDAVKKVVLAYSGGLDTSVILRWLQETYRCEVVTFTADLSQGDELAPARKKAELLAAPTAPKEGWFSPAAGHENLAQFGALEAAMSFIERWICPPKMEAVAARVDFD